MEDAVETVTMSKRLITIILGVTVALALVPWIAALVMNRGLLHVPPEFTNDSGYYFAQLHDVAHGYPFIGNPYFKEYANEPATSFFGADWIAAAPLLIGIPLVPAIIFDTAIAFAIFAWLLIALSRKLGMRGWWIIAALVAVLASSYWLMERPVSMQIVFPCFAFFLLSYLAWLKDPDSHVAKVMLISSSALAFYVYTFLWQIVVIVFGLTHVFFFVYERRRLISLVLIDAATILLVLPVLWYTYLQLHESWYWQTMTRTGFVATHTFGSSAIITALITIAMFGVLWILCTDRMVRRTELIFFSITGTALLVAAFSTVVTGKDMEAAIHFIRFSYVWAALTGVYALSVYFGSGRIDWRKDMISRYSVAALVIVAFLAWNMFQTIEGFRSIDNRSVLASQVYAATMQWLNKNVPAGSVIFADDSFSYYVPVMTDDYVLFQPDGGLYLIPDTDVQNRYLASRIFDSASRTDIENDLRLYAGAGNANDGPQTADRSAKLCMIFIRSNCPPMVSALSYMGASYFNDLYARYQKDLTSPEAALAHYNVSYIVKDTELDPQMQPQKLKGTKLLATVGRFEIYTFNTTSTY